MRLWKLPDVGGNCLCPAVPQARRGVADSHAVGLGQLIFSAAFPAASHTRSSVSPYTPPSPPHRKPPACFRPQPVAPTGGGGRRCHFSFPGEHFGGAGVGP